MSPGGSRRQTQVIAGGWTLSCAGDAAMVLECEQRISPEINAHVIAVAEAFRSRKWPGIRDVVESYCAVTLHFDPLKTDVTRLVQELRSEVEHGLLDPQRVTTGRRQLTVPVCYGGEYGPDLEALATFARYAPVDVVEAHAAERYRVYMLGFLPGFAYMASVPAALAMPRRSIPRLEVPRGSVGIAGRQTGVYSVAAPSGWQVIGRTPLVPFDMGRPDPFLFRPGDEIRFTPVNEQEFKDLSGHASA